MPANTRRQSRKKRLPELLSLRKWDSIGETEWTELAQLIPGLRSEDLRAAGVSGRFPWCGVGQHSLDELEGSLTGLARVAEDRPELGRFCRSEVIRAKDRARIISRSASVSAEKQALKREMVEWMLVWLGNPAIFESWVRIRRTQTLSPQQL